MKKIIYLILAGLFLTTNLFASTLTYTDPDESSGTLIKSSHWNDIKHDIQNFLDSNLLDSNDNIKAGGISSTALATSSVTDVKIAGITTAGKVNGSALTGLTNIPVGAGVIPSANVPATAPTNFRSGLSVTQAGNTTLTVSSGVLEINNTLVTKTSSQTIDITLAGSWAGGVLGQTTSTFAFVGVNASGTISLSTTAPTNIDYALSYTSGVKRYASWSSVTFRVIGWFYMNSTGSGQLNAWEVGNFKDGDTQNSQAYFNANTQGLTSNTYVDITNSTIHFYSTGRPVLYRFLSAGLLSSGITAIGTIWNFDGSNIANSEKLDGSNGTSYNYCLKNDWQDSPAQGGHTYKVQGKVSGSTYTFTSQILIMTEN